MKWIFFDMGETLVNEYASYEGHFENCCASLKEFEIEVTVAEYREMVKECYKTNTSRPLHTVWQSFNVPKEKPKWSHNKDILFERTEKNLAILSSKYNLGIIANQSKNLEDRLEKYGIKQYFKVVVSSEKVGVRKTNLAIFKMGLLQAKIEPNQAVYVGDRIDNDIIPAKKLGMKAIRIKQGLGRYHQEDSVYQSDAIINNLSELLYVVDEKA